MIWRLLLILLLSGLVVCSKRVERGITFPTGSAMGLIVAAAFPVNVKKGNFYCSTNFEANYGLPSQATAFTQGLYDKVLFGTELSDNEATDVNVEEDEGKALDEIADETSRRKKRSEPINRKIFYEMLERKMEIHGVKGRLCLLKTICSVAYYDIQRNNAVHGTLFHILFSPSSSQSEELPSEYYQAEIDGKIGNCEKYQGKCKKSLFDMVFVE